VHGGDFALSYLYAMKLFSRVFSAVLGVLMVLPLACKDKDSAVSEQTAISVQEVVKITPDDIDQLSFQEYELSPQVKSIVVDWNGYEQLASSISYLRTADLSFFKSDMELIKTTMADLRIGIPRVLDTRPIQSRLSVVETMILKLQNDLTLDNISKEQQLKAIREVLVAWSNLNLTMNKKLEFESNDAQRPE
jgi:hypothetical protein